MNDTSRKNRLIALVVTIAFHLIVIVGLLVGTMHYSAMEEKKWPPVDSSEILFGGEYVMLGENLSSVKSAPQAPVKPAETESKPEPLVTANEESPAKVKKNEEQVEEKISKEEAAERERKKREQELSKQVKNRVKFGKKGNGDGEGKAGAESGNSLTGTVSGTPGHTLKGRTLESFGRPQSQQSGIIRIKVRVNRDGYVVGTPEYVNGEGPAAAKKEIRTRCINASKESRFSVSLDAQAEQVGVITWRFE